MTIKIDLRTLLAYSAAMLVLIALAVWHINDSVRTEKEVLEYRVTELERQTLSYSNWLREQEAILAHFQKQLDEKPDPVLPPVGDWEGVMK